MMEDLYRFDLTPLEKKACGVIGEVLESNGFGDNEWTIDYEVAGVTKAGFYDTDLCEVRDIPWDDREQLGGLLSSLARKNVIALEEDKTFVESSFLKVSPNGKRKLIVKRRPRVLVWGIGKAVSKLATM